jgi:hypothetical protein
MRVVGTFQRSRCADAERHHEWCGPRVGECAHGGCVGVAVVVVRDDDGVQGRQFRHGDGAGMQAVGAGERCG